MHFTTVTKIPEYVIERIGLDLRELMMEELRKNQGLVPISNEKLNRIEEAYTHVLQEYIIIQHASCDGYYLTRHHINVISQNLENGHRIGAIKTFREATGASIVDAKNFLMKFEMNSDGVLAFRNAFS